MKRKALGLKSSFEIFVSLQHGCADSRSNQAIYGQRRRVESSRLPLHPHQDGIGLPERYSSHKHCAQG